MEAVTNVDHTVAAALSTRHHPHTPANSTTRSARKLRVQAAILMPVREALKTLHESQDCTWKGLYLSVMPPTCSVCVTAPPDTPQHAFITTVLLQQNRTMLQLLACGDYAPWRIITTQ